MAVHKLEANIEIILKTGSLVLRYFYSQIQQQEYDVYLYSDLMKTDLEPVLNNVTLTCLIKKSK